MEKVLMPDCRKSVCSVLADGKSVWDTIQTWSGGPNNLPLRAVARYMTNAAECEPLTQDEVTFIKGKGASLVPIWNNGTQEKVTAKVSGANTVQDIVQVSDALGLPDNAYVVYDLENWKPSPEWIFGYLAAMRESRLGGSGIFYGSKYTILPWFDWLKTQAPDMIGQRNLARALLWVADWQPGLGETQDNLPSMPAWLESMPQIVAWQYADTAYGNLCDVSLLLPGRITAPGILV